jgi:hypothetical protein
MLIVSTQSNFRDARLRTQDQEKTPVERTGVGTFGVAHQALRSTRCGALALAAAGVGVAAWVPPVLALRCGRAGGICALRADAVAAERTVETLISHSLYMGASPA